MRILYPYDPFDEKQADEPFRDEYLLLKSKGIPCSLFDYDSLDLDIFIPRPQLDEGELILYRGWMMNPELYEKLASMVGKKGCRMITPPEDYVRSHHLPGWYKSCVSFTPETVFCSSKNELKAAIDELFWERYFIKDYVKSNYGDRGSIASSAEECLEIVELIEKHRGELEGGISIRRVEEYVPGSESRYFVMYGKAYGPTGRVPELVSKISEIHRVPFFSVDVIERTDGTLRLVELGDGQVSDMKDWDPEPFCQMIVENA